MPEQKKNSRACSDSGNPPLPTVALTGSTASSSEAIRPTDEECSVLRHMLGIDLPHVQHPKPYRDYFCADKGDLQLQAMAARGLVERYSQRGGWDWYRCTDAGRAAAFASHKAIRYSKPKRVYLRYLSASDAYPDLTFHEFLTSDEFRDARRNA